ncbi:hypothetical protein GW17_00057305, partial [Ensete ventricosum]
SISSRSPVESSGIREAHAHDSIPRARRGVVGVPVAERGEGVAEDGVLELKQQHSILIEAQRWTDQEKQR